MEHDVQIEYVVKTELYTEECCELCGEVIHHHFDCPVCNDGYEGTSLFSELELDNHEFNCECCNSEFIAVEPFKSYTKDILIKVVKIGSKVKC